MKILHKFEQFNRLIRLLADVNRGVKDLKEVESPDTYFHTYNARKMGLGTSCTLDIGCGDDPKNPFEASDVFGLDIRQSIKPNIRYADLAVEHIPFDSDMFDYITAFDVIEHIPRIIYMPERRFPFVELMNEIWRVLRPDGIFFSRTPFYPFCEAFRDPTHVNIITQETFSVYFDDVQRMGRIYGFRGSFKIISQARHGYHLFSLLQKTS